MLRRPCSLAGAGAPHFKTAALARTEGARDASGSGAHSSLRGVRKRKCSDPRASAPRDTEACRSPNCRKSAQSRSVPRAVFEGLLRMAPDGLTFRATVLSFRIVGRLSTALGPDRFRLPVTGDRRRPSRPGDARRCAPGPCDLGRRAASPHLQRKRHSPATAPRPMSEMLAQTPLGTKRDIGILS